jgi:hypothetical protein
MRRSDVQRKTHPDRAKRIDFAASGATKGSPNITRAKNRINARREKTASDGPPDAHFRLRERKPDQNGTIVWIWAALESKLASALRETLSGFEIFEQIRSFNSHDLIKK